MNYPVTYSFESKRECGYRKAGKDGVGIYLVGDLDGTPCPRMPFPLDLCPCCGAGIKFSRGFTWIKPTAIFARDIPPLPSTDADHAWLCPMCSPERLPVDQAGLLWIGKRFYTPGSFVQEANKMGVSRRINSVPRDFKFGLHFVAFAHKEAIPPGSSDEKPSPGIIMFFRPRGIDLVIDDPAAIPEKAANLFDAHRDHARLIKVYRHDTP